ncbi:hypothetical protein HPB51_011360 [Rhipicephalus microplus]|uniref:ZSWIM3 N-terminal domain-containing protein n=1 Tax=Rhipicephalus microplus TaxID=6941 RepID=A0A9J6DG96_RHIMP|nr:hypothetical protein HPB51_011360 [Rhipicephalus microplus]
MQEAEDGKVQLAVGDRFGTFEDLEACISRFSAENCLQLWKRDARTIAAAKNRVGKLASKMSESLKFRYQFQYCCIHGGAKFISTNQGARKSSTFKRDCSFTIYIAAEKEGKFLEVREDWHQSFITRLIAVENEGQQDDDFIGLPCATFYKAKSHHATKETADRLLEKIASGNVSDIGESDDEDDIPHEDVPRENCDTPSSTKGEDGGDRSPLKEIRVEDNVPKNFQWKKKVYAPPSDIDFSGHECPPEADETCTPYTYFSRPEADYQRPPRQACQLVLILAQLELAPAARETRRGDGKNDDDDDDDGTTGLPP